MPLTSSLLQLTLSQFKSMSLSTPSLHGCTAPSRSPFHKPCRPPPPTILRIRALKMMQGRVICDTNDKTVSVEVVRIAPHPKYKRRLRLKKKYQVHDPDNKFKVGDLVLLQKSRPISKTKSFVALPAPPRNMGKQKEVLPPTLEQIGIPLESQQS